MSKLRRDSASSTHPSVDSSTSAGADSEDGSYTPPPTLVRQKTFPEPPIRGRPNGATKPPLTKAYTFDPTSSSRHRSTQSLSESSPPQLPPFFADESAIRAPLMPSITIADAPIPPPRERHGSTSAKRWFSSLLSRVSTHDAQPQGPRTKHQRGEVVCLSYNTLDDAEMMALDGRSDHRPVVGSYALYV